MDRNEAIEHLKVVLKTCDVQDEEAVEMAIEALSCSEIPNSSDTISRQQSIDALRKMQTYKLGAGDDLLLIDQAEAQTELMMLPPAQPDIIRCKDCKHWNHQFKTANGDGLGSCDFHNVALVTSEGFCYWAERREE